MDKYIEKLEFNKVIDNLCEFTVTYLGKELAYNLVPYKLNTDVKFALDETSESFVFIKRIGTPPLTPISNVSDYLNILKVNGVLSLKGLLSLANVLKLSRNLKEYLNVDIDLSFSKILIDYFSNLYTNIGIENDVLTLLLMNLLFLIMLHQNFIK